MMYDRNNLPEELLNLPDSAFESLHQEDIRDEKFQTKPIGFFKDAMIRLAHSKVSMFSVAVITIIIVFCCVAPCPSTVEYFCCSFCERCVINCCNKIVPMESKIKTKYPFACPFCLLSLPVISLYASEP